MENYIGKKVIVRCVYSGVFFGTLLSQKGQEVELGNFRKIYYWKDAYTIEDIATNGINRKKSKVTVVVKNGIVTDATQIIKCEDRSIECIEGIKEWKIEQ
jgi:hypothetical protein